MRDALALVEDERAVAELRVAVVGDEVERDPPVAHLHRLRPPLPPPARGDGERWAAPALRRHPREALRAALLDRRGRVANQRAIKLKLHAAGGLAGDRAILAPDGRPRALVRPRVGHVQAHLAELLRGHVLLVRKDVAQPRGGRAGVELLDHVELQQRGAVLGGVPADSPDDRAQRPGLDHLRLRHLAER